MDAPKNTFRSFLSIFQLANLSFSANLSAKMASFKELSLEPSLMSLLEIEALYNEVFGQSKLPKISSPEAKKLILAMLTLQEVLLQKPYEQFNENDWAFLASMTPTFSVFSLKHQIFTILRSGKSSVSRQSYWTVELDELLLMIIASYDPSMFGPMAVLRNPNVKWSNVAIELCRKIRDLRLFKTDKQCKERWLNHLNPFLNKKAWTPKEDVKLLEEALKSQNKWSEIAKKFIGRTQHAVKNRYICLIGRCLHVSKEKIREAIKNKGAWKMAVETLDTLRREKRESETLL